MLDLIRNGGRWKRAEILIKAMPFDEDRDVVGSASRQVIADGDELKSKAQLFPSEFEEIEKALTEGGSTVAQAVHDGFLSRPLPEHAHLMTPQEIDLLYPWFLHVDEVKGANREHAQWLDNVKLSKPADAQWMDRIDRIEKAETEEIAR